MALYTGSNASDIINAGPGDDAIYGYDPEGAQGQVTSISATRVAAGLSQALFATAAPDDFQRLFIVQKSGQIKIIDFATGQIAPTPFLDVAAEISGAGEGGLLGLAFHPDYASNGFFYVNLINTSGDTEIRRYHVSADANLADAASASLVLTVDQPAGRTNHKAGWLGFGPDGYLYAALGDGGSGGDPDNLAQNIQSLLGKMLRLDLSVDAFPADPSRNYAIPVGNMFAATAGADEIWALGLRNPWRPSFDRAVGGLYIADVGQGRWEEINLGASGANYGWKVYEGPDIYAGGTPSGGTLTFPVHSYERAIGQSITGGYVYRGESEGLHGHYFFADFISARVFSLHHDGSTWVRTERTGQIFRDAGAISNPSSFGEDGRGNLYLVDYDGEIFRLTPRVTSADLGDTLQGGAGDDFLFGGSGLDTARFSGVRDAYTVVKSGLTTTVSGPDGNDTLSGIERLEFSDAAMRLGSALVDTDSNASSDIVWRHVNGEVGVWQMSGVGAPVPASNGAVPLTWRITETRGDYNGDGRTDILWRHANGEVGVWEMSGSTRTSAPTYGVVPLSWNIVDAVADYDGDGRSDVLWRNAGNGETGIWRFGGATHTPTSFGPVAPAWFIVDARGDYDADGRNDILWRNSANGDVGMWRMNGAAPPIRDSLGLVPLAWNIVDAHVDVNADGRSDILWRHAETGEVMLWETSGTAKKATSIGVIPHGWHMLDTQGDYGGDGRTDILWSNADSREVVIWQMNGATRAPTSLGFLPVGRALVDGHADFNADGRSDLLWRDPDGTLTSWQMQGAAAPVVVNLAKLAPAWTNLVETGGSATGDTGADTLLGTVNIDTLYGKGGNDTLKGFAGKDQFAFDTVLDGAGNVDSISDFESGLDRLLLSEVVFSALPRGPLAASSLQSGPAALDADDFILYDHGSGQISYDPDAVGPGSPVPFAVLQGAPDLPPQSVVVGFI